MRAPRAQWKHVLGWAGVSVLAWTLAGLWLGGGGLDTLPRVPAVGAVAAASTDLPVGADPAEPVTFPDRIGRGETLSDVLERNGFTAREIHNVAQALSAVIDVRKLRAGNELEIRYDMSGEADFIQLDRHDLTRVELTRSDLGWQSVAEAVDLTKRVVTLSGALEGSLFASMGRLGESAPLTIAFANVFAWDFDFYTQSREGDQFSIVFEKLYRDGEFVAYGDLRAARYISYQTGERVFSAYLYTDPDGNRDYYNPEGKSMKKAFLRAPLDYQRISSGFSYSRLHPVHKTRRPHLGVDYAARTGTPVYSVASGSVTGRSFGKANGNMVTVKHAMGFVTKYLHLSKFASGLHVGQRVDQKQVIGYVGMTGTATGPHLDFRLYHHGKVVNPVTQIYPPGPPVPEKYFASFEDRREKLEFQLDMSMDAGRMVAIADDDAE